MGQKSGWIISVDGGGTSTEVVLADLQGTPIGEGHSGPSNAKAVGVAAAMKSLDDGIKAAFENAGLVPEPVAVASLGLAGFDRDEDREILAKWADGGSVVQIGKLILTNDGQLVLAAGTSEGWGVGIIGGTGSIAVGKSPSGEFARAGGWGHHSRQRQIAPICQPINWSWIPCDLSQNRWTVACPKKRQVRY